MANMQLNDMVDIDQQWATADEPAGFTPIPDGRYNAVVEVARPEYTSNHQRCLYWELVIVGGSEDGKRIFRRNMLETPQNVGWLKADLRKCGIDVDNPAFTPSGFLFGGTGSLIGMCLDVTLKTGKPNDQGQTYQNCNFNGVVGQNTPAQAPVKAPQVTHPNTAQRGQAGFAPGRMPGPAAQPAGAGVANPWQK